MPSHVLMTFTAKSVDNSRSFDSAIVTPPFCRYYIINSIFNQVKYSPYGECEIIHFVNCEILLALVAMWNKIRSFTRRRRISLPQAISHAPAYFTRSAGTNFTEKSHPLARMAFFLAGAVRIELTTRGFGDRCSTCWAIPLYKSETNWFRHIWRDSQT